MEVPASREAQRGRVSGLANRFGTEKRLDARGPGRIVADAAPPVHVTGQLHIVGTVAGYVPDARRIEEVVARVRPEMLAVVVPPEDIASLDRLRDDPSSRDEMGVPDDLEELRLKCLESFGPVAMPSPDAETIHRLAREHNIPLVALDMDDERHSSRYTHHVKFRHIVQSNAIRNRLRKKPPQATSPYAFQATWEHDLARPKGIRRVETERIEHIVQGLQALRHRKTVAVVPTALMPAICSALPSTPAPSR